MDEPSDSNSTRTYLWPRFALAGVLLAVLLGIVWMNAAVQKIRRTKSFSSEAIPTSNSNVADSLPAADNLTRPPIQSLSGGNAESGKRIFFEKPEANCAKCHKVGGIGGDLGPALDGVASRQSREQLLDALLKPNARIIEGYESVILLLTNNTGVSGLLKRETESELFVLTAEDGLITVPKGNVKIRQRGLSPMPEGLAQLLSEENLRDLVEFMAELK